MGQKESEVWHPLMPASSSATCAASGTTWPRSFFRAQMWALQKKLSGLGRKLASTALCGRSIAEYIMRNAGPDEAQAGIKIAGKNINNLGYADDTTLMAESEEELRAS